MENLKGTQVLVHPELTTDPAQRQGQIGTISSIDLGRDEVYVSFGSAPLALYATDALLVLKPHQDLYRDLMDALPQMETHDFKTLLRISMTLENGSPRQLLNALEMVADNDQIMKYAAISLQERIEQSLAQDQQQDCQKGLGR